MGDIMTREELLKQYSRWGHKLWFWSGVKRHKIVYFIFQDYVDSRFERALGWTELIREMLFPKVVDKKETKK